MRFACAGTLTKRASRWHVNEICDAESDPRRISLQRVIEMPDHSDAKWKELMKQQRRTTIRSPKSGCAHGREAHHYQCHCPEQVGSEREQPHHHWKTIN